MSFVDFWENICISDISTFFAWNFLIAKNASKELFASMSSLSTFQSKLKLNWNVIYCFIDPVSAQFSFVSDLFTKELNIPTVNIMSALMKSHNDRESIAINLIFIDSPLMNA